MRHSCCLLRLHLADGAELDKVLEMPRPQVGHTNIEGGLPLRMPSLEQVDKDIAIGQP